MYEYLVAEVIDIHDGDTLHVRLDLGLRVSVEVQRLRLAGLDAPELSTPLGLAARGFLQETLSQPGTLVCRTTVKKEFEKFGGVLGILILKRPDGTELNINTHLVENNYAVPYDGKARTLDKHTGLPL